MGPGWFPNFYMRKLIIYPTIMHTANYTPAPYDINWMSIAGTVTVDQFNLSPSNIAVLNGYWGPTVGNAATP
jgi:hypothetical protein